MNAVLESFKKLWGELGVSQRLSLGFGVLIVIFAMTGLLMWSSKPSFGLLYGRVDPKQMSEIVEHLESNGIDYRLEQGGSAVFVPKEMINRARLTLASSGLPSGGNAVGFEIFDRTNFGISDFIQRTNYTRAIQGELARTISQMQGVRSARVMVVMPESKLLVTNQKARATASVFVETSVPLERDGVNAIRFLVANAVDGLLVDDVAVVDQRGNMLTADMKDDPLLGAASGQLKFKQNIENYLSHKIEGLLGKMVGANNVVARVSVDLETETVTKRSQTYDPEGQVVRSQTQTEDSHLTSEVKSQGATPVGAGANAPQVPAAGNPSNSTQDTRKNRTIAYEINQSTVESIKSPGDIRKMTAAVFIAMRLGEDGKPQLRSEDEMNRIKQMVANAIGTDVKQNSSAITVEEVPFDASSLPILDKGPTLVDNLFVWTDIFARLAPVGLGMVLLIVFFRLLKKAKTKEVTIEFIEEEPIPVMPKRKKPPVTAEMLNHLIQEEPESISSTLKDWALSENKTS